MLAVPGRVVVCTDTLVQELDFRLEWSSARQVGVKVAAQNLADVAAMGARPLALLASLAAPPGLRAQWTRELADGLAEESARAGAAVVGGDLAEAPQIVITGTALGVLAAEPVLRSGARPGQVVALAGRTGRSAAGLALLTAGAAGLQPVEPAGVQPAGRPGVQPAGRPGVQPAEPAGRERADPAGSEPAEPAGLAGRETAGLAGLEPAALAGLQATGLAELVEWHLAPRPDYRSGVEAALAGATALIDTSDGLLRDAGRIAAASGVQLELDPEALRPGSDLLAAAAACGLPAGTARKWVLTGGEDHALLGCFPAGAVLPPSFRAIGTVAAGAAGQVLVGGEPWPGSPGWQHFG